MVTGRLAFARRPASHGFGGCYSTAGPTMPPWKLRAAGFWLVTEIVTNIEIWQVSIFRRTPNATSVNMTAGNAPVDTNWLFLPTFKSVMRKSTARFDGP